MECSSAAYIHDQLSHRKEESNWFNRKYNFQVNVGQELLPGLLHTARCFKIKGLDNVETPPGLSPPGLSEHHVSKIRLK